MYVAPAMWISTGRCEHSVHTAPHFCRALPSLYIIISQDALLNKKPRQYLTHEQANKWRDRMHAHSEYCFNRGIKSAVWFLQGVIERPQTLNRLTVSLGCGDLIHMIHRSAGRWDALCVCVCMCVRACVCNVTVMPFYRLVTVIWDICLYM